MRASLLCVLLLCVSPSVYGQVEPPALTEHPELLPRVRGLAELRGVGDVEILSLLDSYEFFRKATRSHGKEGAEGYWRDVKAYLLSGVHVYGGRIASTEPLTSPVWKRLGYSLLDVLVSASEILEDIEQMPGFLSGQASVEEFAKFVREGLYYSPQLRRDNVWVIDTNSESWVSLDFEQDPPITALPLVEDRFYDWLAAEPRAFFVHPGLVAAFAEGPLARRAAEQQEIADQAAKEREAERLASEAAEKEREAQRQREQEEASRRQREAADADKVRIAEIREGKRLAPPRTADLVGKSYLFEYRVEWDMVTFGGDTKKGGKSSFSKVTFLELKNGAVRVLFWSDPRLKEPQYVGWHRVESLDKESDDLSELEGHEYLLRGSKRLTYYGRDTVGEHFFGSVHADLSVLADLLPLHAILREVPATDANWHLVLIEQRFDLSGVRAPYRDGTEAWKVVVREPGDAYEAWFSNDGVLLSAMHAFRGDVTVEGAKGVGELRYIVRRITALPASG